MKFQLITLSGSKLDEEVAEVTLPTADGVITILPHHEPLVSLAKPGVITVRRRKDDPDNKLDHFAAEGGIIEVTPRSVRILVDEATHGDEIHESEAVKALERAKELRAQAKGQVELDKALADIDRQQVRLNVAKLRRHHHERS